MDATEDNQTNRDHTPISRHQHRHTDFLERPPCDDLFCKDNKMQYNFPLDNTYTSEFGTYTKGSSGNNHHHKPATPLNSTTDHQTFLFCQLSRSAHTPFATHHRTNNGGAVTNFRSAIFPYYSIQKPSSTRCTPLAYGWFLIKTKLHRR